MRPTRVQEGDTLILKSGEEFILSVQEILREKDHAFDIVLTGNLRSDAVHDLYDELESLVIMGFGLRIDMEKVEYISSACSKAFLNLQLKVDREGKGSLVLRNVPSAIYAQMESIGLTELLEIE